MLKYVSNTGGGNAVDFETAILDGFAKDGGLYVPETLPKISPAQLIKWQKLDYLELAFEILSLFIDRAIVSEAELKDILATAYAPFENKAIIPLHKLKSRDNVHIMELFHGPTISFKDIGLAFLVNLVNFFLARKSERLTLVVATTGDTGPATAYFAAGKSNLDAWVLYPKGLITAEQERQMTCLQQANIHPFGVANCPEGGDDLDAVISKLYANKAFKQKLKLSSVNSINWGRVMMQTVHYFYGYFQVSDKAAIDKGVKVNFSVPSGGFGNLCAGALAREMGLPVNMLVAANNQNGCLDRIFSQATFDKQALINTPSSAIDILIPVNFWRYLYFKTAADCQKIKHWIEQFKATGKVEFDQQTFASYSRGFLSNSASDAQTLQLISEIFQSEGYLLDPHGAVSLQAFDAHKETLKEQQTICLATAHPAKFPATIRQALNCQQLPAAASHHSIETAKRQAQKVHLCEYEVLEPALIHAMQSNWELNTIKTESNTK